MEISEGGKVFIKKFEGCRLIAYKAVPTEKFWTIGWGHYSSSVKAGEKITQKKADQLFDEDIKKYERYVNDLKMNFKQHQFDALVSFAYNCGPVNLERLCSARTIPSISQWIPAYNKSGGATLRGLTIRRAQEKILFDGKTDEKKQELEKTTRYVVATETLYIRQGPTVKAAIIGQLKRGQTVQVLSIDQAKWAKIKSNKDMVYVSSIYLRRV